MLDSRDLAVNIRGAACTGKTATLQEVHRGLEESGRRVLAVAPTMSAVEELRKVGFSDAVTVERLLQDQSVQEELRGKVLVVDEAGMISGRQMSDLLKLAELQSARLVFSGDTQQIQSVEASDALRMLEKESQLDRGGVLPPYKVDSSQECYGDSNLVESQNRFRMPLYTQGRFGEAGVDWCLRTRRTVCVFVRARCTLGLFLTNCGESVPNVSE